VPRPVSAILLTALILWGASAAPAQHGRKQQKPVYVDRGACEGEACRYGRWKTREATAIYARPDERSRKVGELRAGRCVVALTGEVQVFAPGRFVVRKAWERFKPGDVIAAYTYLGEEIYKIRHKGRWHASQQLTYSPPPGPGANEQCDLDERCWGVFEKKPDAVWWIKMRDGRGRVGWTREPQHFDQPYWLSASDCKSL
jgi:hypothetical protein